jgi:hypothetical protein
MDLLTVPLIWMVIHFVHDVIMVSVMILTHPDFGCIGFVSVHWCTTMIGYSEWNGDCVACTDTNLPLVFAMVSVSFISVLIIYVLSQAESGLFGLAMYFIQVRYLNPLATI